MSPAKVDASDERGWIVPVGGREDKVGDAAILRRFAELCGADQARIAVIPTASSQSDTGARYENLFGELGVRRADTLAYADRRDTEREDWLRALDTATGIFLTGGNQLRISTILGGTPVAKAIRRRNARGVHVGGTSAGAAVLSEHMIAMGEEGPTPHAGMTTLAPGFGLTNRVVIDQHFRQRDRLGRLLAALAYNPFAVGLGLDEDTAAFIDPGDVIHVHGAGAITVVDAAGITYSSIAGAPEGAPVCMTDVRLHVLTAGAKYHLSRRVAVPPWTRRCAWRGAATCCSSSATRCPAAGSRSSTSSPRTPSRPRRGRKTRSRSCPTWRPRRSCRTSAACASRARATTDLKISDSRRLMGPNLLLDVPAAIVDVALDPGEDAAAAIAAWEREVRRIAALVDLPVGAFAARAFAGGASMAFAAPIDRLLPATDVNEAAIAAVAGETAPPSVDELRAAVAAAAAPRLPALAREADAAGLLFLWTTTRSPSARAPAVARLRARRSPTRCRRRPTCPSRSSPAPTARRRPRGWRPASCVSPGAPSAVPPPTPSR